MLLDVFDVDNSITINYKTIKAFGLPTAVYLTELLSIYKKASRKHKMVDEKYFKLDRKYITKLLDLSSEEQLICDANLLKTSVLKKHKDDPDTLQLDVNLYLSIIACEDVKLIENVRKQMKVKRPRGVKQSQKQQYINMLKNTINTSNYELLTALRNWVDGVYSNPKGFLSKTSVKVFQDTLNTYTEGNLDLALRIVQIATVQGYRDCQWAINLYEKDEKYRAHVVRVTAQEVATKDQLSDEVF